MTSGGEAPFDEIGERYEKSFTERTAQEEDGTWLIENLPRPARVLDLGCGTGVPTAVQMHEAGLEVVGIDESIRMIELARERVPAADFRCQDMRELSAELGTFDAVVAFFALLMLSKAEIRALLPQIRQRLKPGGLFLLGMVHGDFDQFPISFMGVTMCATALPPAELSAEVQGAGFDVLSMREVSAEVEPGRMEVQLFLRAAVAAQ